MWITKSCKFPIKLDMCPGFSGIVQLGSGNSASKSAYCGNQDLSCCIDDLQAVHCCCASVDIHLCTAALVREKLRALAATTWTPDIAMPSSTSYSTTTMNPLTTAHASTTTAKQSQKTTSRPVDTSTLVENIEDRKTQTLTFVFYGVFAATVAGVLGWLVWKVLFKVS